MLKSLKEKRAKLITDAQQLVSKKDVTAEERAKAHVMLADVDLLEQDIAIEERAATLAVEQRSSGRPPRAQAGEGTAVTDETRAAEKAAFVDYIKYGTRNTSVLKEQRDLTTGNTGVVIAQDFYGTIIEAQCPSAYSRGSPSTRT